MSLVEFYNMESISVLLMTVAANPRSLLNGNEHFLILLLERYTSFKNTTKRLVVIIGGINLLKFVIKLASYLLGT